MAEEVDILIVGGGAAGIAAARELAGKPLKVRLVEAAARLGGRARTYRLSGMPLDLGCTWLHSADRNWWARLARELGADIDETPPPWQEQWQNIGFSAAEQKEACAAFDAFEQRLRDHPPADDVAASALDPECKWNAWMNAVSGFISGAGLDHISARDTLNYDDADTNLNHRLVEGYGALIASAMPAIPLSLEAVVTEIDHGKPLVRVTTSAGAILARAVILTVSTAVLAREQIRFTPPLPDKADAAARLPLGLANKVFLLLDRPEPFESDTQLIGDPRSADSGSYHLRPLGRPVIESFFGGSGARDLEAEGQGAATDFAIEQLVALLGSGMRKRLSPLAVTRWAAEPHIGGAYSYAMPHQAGGRQELARPVADRLFFAGEACSASDFSTAHGAHDTGVAAARAAMAALK